ncbi:MAG: hypothetical protein ACTSRK_15255 [Promethearchaeota archaeon]
MVSPKDFKDEVLRYLGADSSQRASDKTADISVEKSMEKSMDELIDEVILEVMALSKPHHLISTFPIEIDKVQSDIRIQNSNVHLVSSDLTHLLEKSDRCGIIIATLGMAVDQRIKFYGKTDLTKGVIFDAAASAYIEAYCDEVQNEFGKEYRENGLTFTFRYAPGYGDLGLEVQPLILELLQAPVKIGVSASNFFTLYPRKSITGIFGIIPIELAETEIELKGRPKKVDHPLCKNCKNYKNCIYLSEGTFCEYRKRNQ